MTSELYGLDMIGAFDRISWSDLQVEDETEGWQADTSSAVGIDELFACPVKNPIPVR